MTRSKTIFAGGVLATLIALPAAAQDGESAPVTRDTVVATVNGTDITLGHMILLWARLPEQYREMPDTVLYSGMLEQIVKQTLLSQAFSGEPPDYIRLSLDNEERGLRASQEMSTIVQQALTEEAIQDLYAKRYVDSLGPEYNASHILVETEAEAREIVAELEAGADFATLAQERSTGPSAPEGGSLGGFGAGAMVAPFEAAVTALEPGAVSAPVETQFGWHVIKLNDIRTPEAPPLEDVRSEIIESIRSDTIERRLSDLRDSAEITKIAPEDIDISAISDISLIVD